MQIVSVIPNIGTGGLTRAVLNRSSLFADTGHVSMLLVYEFNLNFSIKCRNLVLEGILDSKVRVLNPYQYFSEYFKERSGYTSLIGNLETHPFREKVGNSVKETRFSYAGAKVASVEYESDGVTVLCITYYDTAGKISTIEKFAEGYVALVEDFLDGALISERYLTPGGFCYLRKEYEADNRKLLRLWFWHPEKDRFVQYNRIWDWRREFVKIISRTFSQPTVLLCDGNNVPAQFLRLKSRSIKPVAVIHMNHVLENGSIRIPYAAYFDRLDEFDAVICLTQEQARDLSILNGRNPNIAVIPNYVPSVDTVTKVNVDPDSNQDAVIVTRLAKGKGLQDIVDAFRLVVSRIPGAGLRIFGEGSQRRNLEESVKKLGLNASVEFAGRTSNPVQEMADSRVALFASESEGFGLTIVESLAAGTPVVAMACNYGPDELIVDGLTGYVVSDRDLNLFADRICEILTNDELRNQMSLEAIRWTRANLGRNAVLQKWENLFNSFIPQSFN